MCTDNKIFYKYCEEGEDMEMGQSQDIKLEDTTPTISCHAFVGISIPRTLKIEGYIEKKNVTVVIDFYSTHNFNNSILYEVDPTLRINKLAFKVSSIIEMCVRSLINLF